MGKPARASSIVADVVEIFDCEQRSDEWYELRRGNCTASNFASIMASGKEDGAESKGRKKLMHLMAGELLSGRPMETFSNSAMIRGIEMEHAALSHYEFTRGIEVQRVGFVRRTITNPLGSTLVVGCSPDGLVGDDGMVQVKTMQPDVMVALIESGRFPSEHRAQCHGELWVTGRRWTDLMIYYEGMEQYLPTFRVERSEEYISTIRAEVERFAWELQNLVDGIKRKGRR